MVRSSPSVARQMEPQVFRPGASAVSSGMRRRGLPPWRSHRLLARYGCRRCSAAGRLPSRAEARRRHLQHRPGLGRPDHHQEPHRGRVRRGGVADDTQARRRNHALACRADGRAAAVRRLADQDRRSRMRPANSIRPIRPSSARTSTRRAWVTLAHDLGSPSVKVRPNGIPKTVPEEQTLQQMQVLAGTRRVRARQRHHDPAGSPRRRSSRVPRIGRSSITAAIIQTSSPAGIRTRRTSSTAASTRTSGSSAIRSVRSTCAICSSRSTPGAA